MATAEKKRINKSTPPLKSTYGTLALPENRSALEKFRWSICQNFISYKRKHKCTQKQLAELIGIDEPKMSKILRHRIDEFSTDRLISLYEKLNPKVQLKVS